MRDMVGCQGLPFYSERRSVETDVGVEMSRGVSHLPGKLIDGDRYFHAFRLQWQELVDFQ